jgi:splicing suppressor protein 51
LAGKYSDAEGKERREREGTETAAGIECPPLTVQMIPFGSITDMSRMKVLDNWREILIKDIEDGKKLTRFGA